MSILIATPMYGGHCTHAYFQSAINLSIELTKANIEFDFLTTANESLIQRARNTSVVQFLKSEFKKLLFIDADIEFSPLDVARLWNCDVPIACGAYSMKRPGASVCVWTGGRPIEVDKLEGKVWADYAGTGFMMIDRAVFETILEKEPEIKHEEGHVGECYDFFQTGVIFDEPSKSKIFISEDYGFCRLARKHGFKILCDTDIKLGHWGYARFPI